YSQWSTPINNKIDNIKPEEIKLKYNTDPSYQNMDDEFLVNLYKVEVEQSNNRQKKANMQRKIESCKSFENLKREYPNMWAIAKTIEPWNKVEFLKLVGISTEKTTSSIDQSFIRKLKQLTDSDDTFSTTSKKLRTESLNEMKYVENMTKSLKALEKK
ncbi:hypothetical protein RFI_34252, partial [Reticulomyxa filosa]